MKMIDITRDILKVPPYPGDPAPKLTPLHRMDFGDMYNASALSMCVHNGTHMDAPRHFITDGVPIDEVDLNACIGECLIVACDGLITGEEAEELLPRLRSKRVLFKGTVQLTPSAAFVLSDAGLLLMGVESNSVAPAEYTAEVHRQLLGTGMVLLENLDLSEAKTGITYLLLAAPMKIGGADGAPVRAVLVEPQRIDWSENTWNI